MAVDVGVHGREEEGIRQAVAADPGEDQGHGGPQAKAANRQISARIPRISVVLMPRRASTHPRIAMAGASTIWPTLMLGMMDASEKPR